MSILFTILLSALTPIAVQHFQKCPEKLNLLVLAIISNSLLVFGYFLIFQQSFTISYMVTKIVSVFIIALYGFWIFNERLTLKNYVGFAFGFATLYLLA